MVLLKRLSAHSILTFCCLLALAGESAAAPLTRVSISSASVAGNNASSRTTVSADGRYVAFASTASNLVPSDTNGVQDIFVRDRQTGTTTRVSVGVAGAQANGASSLPSISADGRYVAFYSQASNLDPADPNTTFDTYVHDRQTGVTSVVSVSSAGALGIGVSGSSTVAPSISADGRYVAFESLAGNLVAGDTNSSRDIFVRDRQTGTTTRVSVATGGTQVTGNSAGAVLSGDGRYVAFISTATTLVAGDTNGVTDVFLHDRQTTTTTRASVSTAGGQGDLASTGPALSGDGRWLAFTSLATNLVPGDQAGVSDVFLRDLQTGIVTRISTDANGNSGGGASSVPVLSQDGRFAVFQSDSFNLASGDGNAKSDIFLFDRLAGKISNISGGTGDGASLLPAISGDGHTIVFESTATNLVGGDTNAASDIFAAQPLVANWTAVAPNPRATPVSAATLTFSEPVTGVGLEDFVLTRDGAVVPFAGATLNPISPSQYELNLSTESALPGNYRVALAAGGTGIVTVANGDALAAGGGTDWLAFDAADTTAPSVTRIAEIDPVLSSGPLVRFAVAFSEPVVGLDAGDFSLVESGFFGSSISRITPTDGTGRNFEVAVWAATGKGTVALRLIAGGGITDGAGNALATANLPFTGPPVAVDRGSLGTAFRLTRASLGNSTAQGNAQCIEPSVSADGRYLVFSTGSDTIVQTLSARPQIALRDLVTGVVTTISMGYDGQSASASCDYPCISANGRYIAWSSSATNLVPGDTNGAEDIFVYDRSSGQTRRVSVPAAGGQANGYSIRPTLSGDGRLVCFETNASNLVPGVDTTSQILVADQLTGTLEVASVSTTGAVGSGQYGRLTPDGRYVVFASLSTAFLPGDASAVRNIFVRDRSLGTTTLASVSAAGLKAEATCSGPSISNDGRFVTFASGSTTLVPDGLAAQSDIYLRDLVAGSTIRVSRPAPGVAANAGSFAAEISPNGRFVAFESIAGNLTASDPNVNSDLFVFDRLFGTIIPAHQPAGAATANGNVDVTADRRLAFTGDSHGLFFGSGSSNLVAGDTNSRGDIFFAHWLAASIDDVRPNPRASGAALAVHFNDDVTGVNLTDFLLTRDGLPVNLAGATLTSSSARDYTLQLTSLTAPDGAYTLGLAPTGSGIATTTGAVALNTGASESWSKVASPPDAVPPTVLSVTRLGGPGPTNADLLGFLVTFSEPVSGMDEAAFEIAAGGAGGVPAWVIPVTGSTYQVWVPAVTGDGPLRLDVRATAAIYDTAGNALGGGFTTGEAYAVDNTPPSVTISAPSPATIGAGPLTYTITYAGADTVTLANANVTVPTTGTATTTTKDVSGTGAVERTLTISGIAGDGTVGAVLAAGTASDLAGNLAPGATAPLALVHNASPAAYRTLSRVSISSSGVEAASHCQLGDVSADGRFVVFTSDATNLVPGDTNGYSDVFVRDRLDGTTTRVSLTSAGAQANGPSLDPSISADGRYVAFQSTASNLGATLGVTHALVRDRQTGTTTLVSVNTAGALANNSIADPVISADGHFVVFSSSATNLVASDTNATSDVFVRDWQAGVTTRVSVGTGGVQGNGYSGFVGSVISGDGRYVLFTSLATNFAAGDTNAIYDVFVNDRQTGVTTLLSANAAGQVGNAASFSGAITSDGRYATFRSDASNLVPGDTNFWTDVFVRDLQTGTIERVSLADSGAQGSFTSTASSISADGRFVAFASDSTNLAGADTNSSSDVYLRDRWLGHTSRISLSPLGAEPTGGAGVPIISADGRWIAFTSLAANLVPGDAGSDTDVFVSHHVWADLADVSPDPRMAPASTVVTFGEPVGNVGTDDFSLTCNGFPVSLAGAVVTPISATQFSLDLTAVTAAAGTYQLTLAPVASNIVDLTSGDPLTNGDSDVWANYTTPFTFWAAGLPSGQQAFSADSDGDGFSNALEYVLGTDAAGNSASSAPASSVENDRLVFTFGRAEPARTDAILEVLAGNSPDEASAEVIATKVGTAAWTGPATVTEGTAGGGRVSVAVQDIVSMAVFPGRFLRLRVTLP